MHKKVRFMATICFLVTGAAQGHAANVGFNANINIGNEPPQIALVEEPEFISPPSLGFFVAVGIPYDMFYINSSYYLHRDNAWFRGSSYNGPWIGVRDDRRLPRGLRKYKYERIISIRDEEYGIFQRDRDHYKGNHRGPNKRRNQGERREGSGQEQRGREREGGGQEQGGREHGNH